jgi:hypothetical protein
MNKENSYQYLKPAKKDRLVYEHLQSHFNKKFEKLF